MRKCLTAATVGLVALAVLQAGCRALPKQEGSGRPVRSVHVTGLTVEPKTEYLEPHAFLEMLSGFSGSGGGDFGGVVLLIAAPFVAGAVVEEAIRLPARLGRPADLFEALETADFKFLPELRTALTEELPNAGVRVTFGPQGESPESGTAPDLTVRVTSAVLLLEKRDVLFVRARYLPRVRLRVRGDSPQADKAVFDRWFEGTAPVSPPIRRFKVLTAEPDRTAEWYRRACRDAGRELGSFLAGVRLPAAAPDAGREMEPGGPP